MPQAAAKPPRSCSWCPALTWHPLLVAERPAPPRELQVPQADVAARSLCLRWVPGSDGASPIRYFTLQLRELPGGQWQTYSSSISHEATACVVERYRMGREGPALPQGPCWALPPPAPALPVERPTLRAHICPLASPPMLGPRSPRAHPGLFLPVHLSSVRPRHP